MAARTKSKITPRFQTKYQVKISWKTFIKSHLGEIAGADFFSVEVLTLRGLVRYMVFFVIDLKTRRVEIAGICPSPAEPWMKQTARNLTDCDDGFLRGIHYLILDRDPLYTTAFRAMLKDAGVTPLLLPARSPNLNAHAERFALSVKSECVRKLVPLSELHLRYAIQQFAAHYHHERHHQGLAGQLVVPDEQAGSIDGSVVRQKRLGGLLNFYYREAA